MAGDEQATATQFKSLRNCGECVRAAARTIKKLALCNLPLYPPNSAIMDTE